MLLFGISVAAFQLTWRDVANIAIAIEGAHATLAGVRRHRPGGVREIPGFPTSRVGQHRSGGAARAPEHSPREYGHRNSSRDRFIDDNSVTPTVLLSRGRYTPCSKEERFVPRTCDAT